LTDNFQTIEKVTIKVKKKAITEALINTSNALEELSILAKIMKTLQKKGYLFKSYK
jgi:hypothetical protein